MGNTSSMLVKSALEKAREREARTSAKERRKKPYGFWLSTTERRKERLQEASRKKNRL